MSAERRVIFKLDNRFVYLNSSGILWIIGDEPPTMMRGLTKKELTRVVKGLVERLDTIDDGLNSLLVKLDTTDKATSLLLHSLVSKKAP